MGAKRYEMISLIFALTVLLMLTASIAVSAPLEVIAPITPFRPKANSDIVALCLHHVDTEGELSVTRDQLAGIIMELSEKGYKFITANDLRIYNESSDAVPPKLALLTFDDGYDDSYYAASFLESYGVSATYFIVTDKLGKPGYMTKEQVADLNRRGFAIGSHTATHPDLRKLSAIELQREFIFSRDALEDIIGTPVVSIAYPGGYTNRAIADIAAQQYAIGFIASHPGGQEDSMTIQRYGVFSYNWTLEDIFSNEQL